MNSSILLGNHCARRVWHGCHDWHVPCSIRAQKFESHPTPQRKWRGNPLVTLPVHPGASRKIRPPASHSNHEEPTHSNHEEHEGHEVRNVQKQFFVSFVTFVVIAGVLSRRIALIVPIVLTTRGERE